MTLRFLSAYNGFIPQATGQVISYIRSPKDFQLNKYVQYIESPTTVGVYAKIDRDQPVRLVDESDFIWADGADRPSGDWNQMRFQWVEFSVKRRDYPFRIGNLALKQGKDSWKPLDHHVGMTAAQAMTNRTNRVVTALETIANWGSNAASAASLNGGAGKWTTASDQPGDPAYNAIRKTLLEAAKRINLATNGVVKPKDLVLLISPGLATDMSNTAEIHNYLKFGPFSKAQLEDSSNDNQQWGLPPSLYGFPLTVEDTPRVTTRPTAADSDGSRVYVKSDDSAVLLSRKGGINGVYGAPSFSTIQLYWHEYEMAVYTFDDPKHERLDGHVTDMFAEVLAAPEAGFLITGVK